MNPRPHPHFYQNAHEKSNSHNFVICGPILMIQVSMESLESPLSFQALFQGPQGCGWTVGHAPPVTSWWLRPCILGHPVWYTRKKFIQIWLCRKLAAYVKCILHEFHQNCRSSYISVRRYMASCWFCGHQWNPIVFNGKRPFCKNRHSSKNVWFLALKEKFLDFGVHFL